MLTYYSNYLQNLSESSSSSYTDLLQATINDQWDNTTQVIKVKEQSQVGSSVYNSVVVRVDYAIDMGTGYKQDDDHKLFAFQDLTHNVAKGRLYQYDDDYWITINTSEVGSISKDINVRRCTNMMRWIDPQTGYLNEEPCVIEYVLESPNALKNKEIVVANGHISILCQGNLVTRNIPKNTRFLFNGQPFKLLATQNMLDEGITENQNSDLLYIDMYLDMIEPDDDLTNNIANASQYQYTINTYCSINEQVSGFSGVAYSTVTLNGNAVNRNINYSGNSNVTVNTTTGAYTLTGAVGTVATITANIVGNPNLTSSININIVQSITDSYEMVVSPLYDVVKVGQSITFTANEYKNGVVQSTPCQYSVDGLALSAYTLAQTNNSFIITPNTFSSIPISLTLYTQNCTKTVQIYCKSAF
jgi:hypothetical protein